MRGAMRLLEYESKKILRKYQIPTPNGKLYSPTDLVDIVRPVVLKAQIPIGGRGIGEVPREKLSPSRHLEFMLRNPFQILSPSLGNTFNIQ
jgi:hypothetical protein